MEHLPWHRQANLNFQGATGAAHLNPLGTGQVGWFATLLDSALGCAVHTLMPPGRAYTTAELNLNLVKALMPKVQRVRAIGKVIHCGRQPGGAVWGHNIAIHFH